MAVSSDRKKDEQWITRKTTALILAIIVLNVLWYASSNNLIQPVVAGNLVLALVLQLVDGFLLTFILYAALIRPSLRKVLLGYDRVRIALGVKVGGITEESLVNAQRDGEVWGELRDQVLGAIGADAKFGKLKDLRNDVKWLSKKQSKTIFENPGISMDTWLRTLKLFAGASEIYEQRKGSLLNRKDISTTYVRPRIYERNLSNLKDLMGMNRSVIRQKALVDAVRSSPLLLLLMSIAVTNTLFAFVLGYSEINNYLIPQVLAVASVSFVIILLPQLNYVLRFATQKLGIVGENLVVRMISGPILAIVFGLLIYTAVQFLPESLRTGGSEFVAYLWDDPFRKVLLIVGSAGVVVFLLRGIIVFLLERWSGQLAMRYDETFISLTQKVATMYVGIIASAILVASFSGELGIKSPDTILFPYLFAVTLLTGILGYASRDTLENFFAGVMIRMNPPFERGDRIILETGQLCDVREIGMRTVTLYNIQLNAEIYVPNKTASSMTVTNVSRPDLELRIQVPVNVVVAQHSLALAEQRLIDVAYSEPEVDQMIIEDREFGKDKIFWNRERNRFSVRDLLGNLRRIYPRIETTLVATGEIVAGKQGAMHLQQFGTFVDRALRQISDARDNYNEARSRTSKLKCVERIIRNYQDLSNAIYSVGDALPDIKEDLDPLIAEISKEPVVHSNFKVSDQGTAYLALTLNAFAFHLERRFEVEHKLNSAILDRLERDGLLVKE